MNIVSIASYYSLGVGALFCAGWIFTLSTGRIPEFSTQPVETVFHLISELITSAALITAGVAFIKGKEWARRAFYIASGLLCYSLVSATGVYAQRGDIRAVFIFILILILGGLTVGTMFVTVKAKHSK